MIYLIEDVWGIMASSHQEEKKPGMVEIQLGHMCSNRCLFCVSGRQMEKGTSGAVLADSIFDGILKARKSGNDRIILVGGEPTIHPSFLEVVKHCSDLGYEEIVVFTNGIRTSDPGFVKKVLDAGGNCSWRLSVQGPDAETHDTVTKRKGSFNKVLSSLNNLTDMGQNISVNTCLVGKNYAGVKRFPKLLAPYAVSQVHIDLMRPEDSGCRNDKDFLELLFSYPEAVPHLVAMTEGFACVLPGLDLNIGNLPYCIAPEISPWIRHDGLKTDTIAVDGNDRLSKPWNKYEVKSRSKTRFSFCEACVFASCCTGVYRTYTRLRGDADFSAIKKYYLPANKSRSSFQPLDYPHIEGSLKNRLLRIHRSAPFPGLEWEGTMISGKRIDLLFRGPGEEEVIFWLDMHGKRPGGGCNVMKGADSEEISKGLHSIINALKGHRFS